MQLDPLSMTLIYFGIHRETTLVFRLTATHGQLHRSGVWMVRTKVLVSGRWRFRLIPHGARNRMPNLERNPLVIFRGVGGQPSQHLEVWVQTLV